MYFEIEKQAIDAINKALDQYDEEIDRNFKLEFPPNPDLGDLASTIAFALTKKLRTSPPEVAADLVEKIEVPEIFTKVQNFGPYVNFFIDYSKFSKLLLEKVDENYGQLPEYGEKIVTPKNPEKAGYEFSGWTPNLPATMPAKDLEVKPNWTELAITLKNIETFTSNLCEGDDAQINFTHEGGKPISFKITFNEEAVAAGFPKEYDGKIDNDMNIFFTLPSTVEEGSYKASLQLFGASEESNKLDFKFSTNLSSSHLSRMWNDVIVCNNVDKRFTSYQWYKNGEEIPGATNQFYCELGGLNGNYSVKVTSTNGNELFICGLECEYILPPFSISAYPNPAKANEEITLEIEGLTSEELDNAKIFVYNTSGIVAHSNKEVNFKNLVQLPSGSYIGVVELDGKTAF